VRDSAHVVLCFLIWKDFQRVEFRNCELLQLLVCAPIMCPEVSGPDQISWCLKRAPFWGFLFAAISQGGFDEGLMQCSIQLQTVF